MRLRPHGVPQRPWENPKSNRIAPLLHLIAPPTSSPRHLEVVRRASHSTKNTRWTPGTQFQLPGIGWAHPEAINQVVEALPGCGLFESEPLFISSQP